MAPSLKWTPITFLILVITSSLALSSATRLLAEDHKTDKLNGKDQSGMVSTKGISGSGERYGGGGGGVDDSGMLIFNFPIPGFRGFPMLGSGRGGLGGDRGWGSGSGGGEGGGRGWGSGSGSGYG